MVAGCAVPVTKGAGASQCADAHRMARGRPISVASPPGTRASGRRARAAAWARRGRRTWRACAWHALTCAPARRRWSAQQLLRLAAWWWRSSRRRRACARSPRRARRRRAAPPWRTCGRRALSFSTAELAIGVGRDDGEVGHAHDLAHAAERGQPLAHRTRHGAADAGVDLVEDERADAVLRGEQRLPRQEDARQLAARGDARQRARLLSRVRREAELDAVGARGAGRLAAAGRRWRARARSSPSGGELPGHARLELLRRFLAPARERARRRPVSAAQRVASPRPTRRARVGVLVVEAGEARGQLVAEIDQLARACGGACA